MNEPQITLSGNVAAAPALRLAAGTPVTSFRVGATPRRYDKATGTWSDGETLWFTVTAWRALAEHCVASLVKGDKVVVSGRLTQRTWTADDGSSRPGLELDAASIGIDLSRSNALSIRSKAQPSAEGAAEGAAEGDVDGGPAHAEDDDWASNGQIEDDTGVVGIVAALPEQGGVAPEPAGV